MSERGIYKFERAKEGEPTCLSGDCSYKPVPGSQYCPRHGGNKAAQEVKKEELRLYASSVWQAQIGFQADHPKAKSLAEEVGITRIMIQERLNMCKDSADLVMQSSALSSMMEKLEKLVKTWHNIEKDRGLMLDIPRAQRLASDIVGVFTNYVSDTDILEAITEDITQLFSNLADNK